MTEPAEKPRDLPEWPCNDTCQNSSGPVRFYYAHSYSHGQTVEGRVYAGCPHHRLDPLPNSVWTITSIHPLTVTPSLHWTDCGCHGFITNGEWVPV